VKARLTVLSGPRRSERQVFANAAITIGGSPSHALYLPDLAATDPVARIEQTDCTYTITATQPSAGIAVNSQAVEEAVLHDGDLLTIGKTTLRFATAPEHGEACKSFPGIVHDSARAAARLDAGIVGRGLFFLRDLCYCTSCDASRRVKVLCLVTCGLVVAGSVLLGAMLLHGKPEAERQVVMLSQEVAAGTASRRRLEQQVDRLRRLEQENARLGEVARPGNVRSPSTPDG